MDCPRCGGGLTRISLDGEFESVYCEQCRFANVESDHTRASDGAETWNDALRRFRTAHADPDEEGTTGPEAGSDADGESSRDDGSPDDGAETQAGDTGDAVAQDDAADDTEQDETDDAEQDGTDNRAEAQDDDLDDEESQNDDADNAEA
jgi:hypothetical protein